MDLLIRGTNLILRNILFSSFNRGEARVIGLKLLRLELSLDLGMGTIILLLKHDGTVFEQRLFSKMAQTAGANICAY